MVVAAPAGLEQIYRIERLAYAGNHIFDLCDLPVLDFLAVCGRRVRLGYFFLFQELLAVIVCEAFPYVVLGTQTEVVLILLLLLLALFRLPPVDKTNHRGIFDVVFGYRCPAVQSSQRP